MLYLTELTLQVSEVTMDIVIIKFNKAVLIERLQTVLVHNVDLKQYLSEEFNDCTSRSVFQCLQSV